MAENIIKIQQAENTKMLIWAHNGHINLANPDDVLGMKPMGYYLNDKLKEKYYAIGFVFNEGKFQAVKGPNSIVGALFTYVFARKKMYKGLIECSVPSTKSNTLTNHFAQTGRSAFLIDLTNTNNIVFTTKKQTYDIGAVFLNYKRSFSPILAKRQFNGLIYLSNTSRANPLKLK